MAQISSELQFVAGNYRICGLMCIMSNRLDGSIAFTLLPTPSSHVFPSTPSPPECIHPSRPSPFLHVSPLWHSTKCEKCEIGAVPWRGSRRATTISTRCRTSYQRRCGPHPMVGSTLLPPRHGRQANWDASSGQRYHQHRASTAQHQADAAATGLRTQAHM